MNNILLLVFCFCAGVLMRRSGRMPAETPAALNGFIIYLSLPSLVLYHLHGLDPEPGMLLPAAVPWLCFLVSAFAFFLLGRVMKLPAPTVGALMLTGGLGNTAYFGYPMVEAFFGSRNLAHAIIVDQFGSFPVLSIMGVSFARIYSHGRPDPLAIIRRVLIFPAFLALVAVLLLNNVPYPEWLSALLKRLSDMLVPMAVFSVGFQFSPAHIGERWRLLSAGLAVKLLVAPFFAWLLYVPLSGLHGEPVDIAIFEAAMPPMIASGILAAEHGLDPPLANLMVSVGLLVSFLTLSGWSLFLHGFRF